jgi:4-amino-4-deoxy-L-arabinose transferase-like glycosyltransferase
LSFPETLKKRFNLSKQEYFFLVIIIVSASILRLWDLGSIGFNGDEAVYSGQSATLAGYDEFAKYFSIYRAHPLFLQFIVSIFLANFGVTDTIARIVPAIFGIMTAIIVYFIGKELYDKRIAMIAAIVITIIPYHIIVSRQVLLDVPLSFFSMLTVFFVIRYIKLKKESYWLYLIGVSSGLSFLSKEVGIFVLIASIISLIVTRKFSLKSFTIIVSSFLLATSPFWIPILIIPEAHQTALSYWQWQTSRDQNQPDTFYLSIIIRDALGYVLTGLFILSIIYLWKSGSMRNPNILVLLIWIGTTFLFFQILPIKGFHFVQSIVAPLVLLGLSLLDRLWTKNILHYRILAITFIPLILLTTGPILNYIFQIYSPPLAGSGGIPYVREGAMWMKDNIRGNGIILTIDATTANIIKFYANKEVFSLHSNKNPAYTVIGNPDLYILSGQIRYLVLLPNIYENYPHLRDEVDQLSDLAIKYGGVPIHTENQTYTGKNGEILIRPELIIYSLDKIYGE